MSVLVKGMQMPRMCSECDFCGGLIWPAMVYACDCPIDPINSINITKAIEEDCRHPNCPFVEVPTPHGRLIDADEALKGIDELKQSPWFNGDTALAKRIRFDAIGIVRALCIIDAPTIIEADKEVEE